MKNKPIRTVTLGLTGVAILCIAIFTFLMLYMQKRSSNTITEVGSFYMSTMSERITEHFETVMELRLDQVETMTRMISPQDVSYDELKTQLEELGHVRDFDSLAFYLEDGEFEMIYGNSSALTDPDPFLTSLKNGEKKIAVGTDSEGEKIVLIGVPLRDVIKRNGRQKSIALVASIPTSYVSETLQLDTEDALIFSHIIRSDGTYVIRSTDDDHNSYLDRVLEQYETFEGKTAQQYADEMRQAMKERKEYTTVYKVEEQRRQLLCVSLPYSEWNLVTIMPYGPLDESVNDLSNQWFKLMLSGCGVILLALILVFSVYIKLIQNQMKDLEKARQTAVQATNAKSEFLSNMSHDIRTPMNAIVGMTAIATANINNPQQVQDCLKKISLSGRHLLGLINDILDMSKIESGKMTLHMDQVSLREVMDSIVSIIQPQVKTKKQKFDVFIHDISVENVYCDGVRLNQVILNLLSNAHKFTPTGGTIQVALHEEPSIKGEKYVRIHLHVKDSGIGMTPEFRDKIFESFERANDMRVQKTEGSGLGMAITKYIVDAMGGTIGVESEPNQGTEFHVILDLEKAEIKEDDMILPEWNMLVVDDDEQLGESTVATLKTIGVNAEWALDGETAIEMLDQRHSQHRDYQIILLDWKLPGMDGISTAKEIRKRMGGEIPILLISAYDWSDVEEDAKEAGINGFISKPLFKSTLFYGLKEYAGLDINASEEPKEETQSKLKGKKILLAEDNDLNWEIDEALLGEEGLELDRAEDGQICVEKFKQSSVGYYDAILMDIRMPNMTGYEAARAIRAMKEREDYNLPIIAMTADAFSDDIQKSLDSGMNAHVAKPIDIKLVLRQLEKFIQ